MNLIDEAQSKSGCDIETKDVNGIGALIINADDWGRDPQTTDSIFACLERARVSRASGMVFMEDSIRAAQIACDNAFDIGLHLNFTSPFSCTYTPSGVVKHQERIATYLHKSKISHCLFNPTLMNSFEYSVSAQFEEYERLYGKRPARVDGHHHKHLCANIILARLLPAGIKVRRNFSLQAGEKTFLNRSYRRLLDRLLARRHQLTDYFFSISPIEPIARLKRILSLSHEFVVELATHPVAKDEYSLLNGEFFVKLTDSLPLVRPHLRSSI